MSYKEDKIIDLIIQVLELNNAYVPTTLNPANPNLPEMILLTEEAKAIRTAAKAKFQIVFQENSRISQQLSDLKLNA